MTDEADKIFDELFGRGTSEIFRQAARRDDRIVRILLANPAPERLLQHITADTIPFMENVPETTTLRKRFMRRVELMHAVNSTARLMGMEKPIKGVHLIDPADDRHPASSL